MYTHSYVYIYIHVSKEEQNMSPKNMPLWHKDYLDLGIFKKIADTEEVLKT